MNTPNPAAEESLAAQYVLGVLKGPARRRFERDIMQHWRIRQEVWFWERQLQPLAERVPAVPPRADNWQRLSQKLWPDTATTSRWSHWFWPSWAAAATMATLLLAISLNSQLRGQSPGSPDQWVAVVQSAQAEPLWLVDANATATTVRLKNIAAPAIDTRKDYELWVLPRQGAPQSIGILPTGTVEITLHLNPAQFQALLNNQSLAISIEPKGGSPTGLPTGPVVYQSKLLEI
jgi:anti-sigma-K factor RskA